MSIHEIRVPNHLFYRRQNSKLRVFCLKLFHKTQSIRGPIGILFSQRRLEVIVISEAQNLDLVSLEEDYYLVGRPGAKVAIVIPREVCRALLSFTKMLVTTRFTSLSDVKRRFSTMTWMMFVILLEKSGVIISWLLLQQQKGLVPPLKLVDLQACHQVL